MVFVHKLQWRTDVLGTVLRILSQFIGALYSRHHYYDHRPTLTPPPTTTSPRQCWQALREHWHFFCLVNVFPMLPVQHCLVGGRGRGVIGVNFARITLTVPTRSARNVDCQSHKQKCKNEPIKLLLLTHCDWFVSSCPASVFENLVFTSKRHNHCKAYNADSNSILLLVKTSL